jgi:hypothetical protein
MNTNTIRTRTSNRAFAAFIAAFAFAGTVATAPPATAVTWVPEPDTTTSAATFDIGLWVAERKARMARDWIDHAKYRSSGANIDVRDEAEMVTKAKARAAQG